MYTENLKNNTALQKWKLYIHLYLGENRLEIFQAKLDTTNVYRTLPNSIEHDFSDEMIEVKLKLNSF